MILILLPFTEKISNTERHLDQSKGHTSRAEERTNEIKQLNKSIFRPVITFNKESKRQREEERLAARYAAEREEREQSMREVRESQNRIGRAAGYGAQEQDTYGQEAVGGRGPRTEAQRAGRSRFQFEKSASDDELEDELDDNIDEIHDVTKRLKAIAMAQNEELGRQNERLDRLNNNATRLDDKLQRATNNVSAYAYRQFSYETLLTINTSAQAHQVELCGTGVHYSGFGRHLALRNTSPFRMEFTPEEIFCCNGEIRLSKFLQRAR